MSLTRETEVYLNHTQRFLSERKGIPRAIRRSRQRPEVLNQALEDLELAVLHLNGFINSSDKPLGLRQALLPFSTIIKTELEEGTSFYFLREGKNLPSPKNEAGRKTPQAIEEARAIFKQADKFMYWGDLNVSGGWKFHRQLKDLSQLVNSFAIEMYGLLAAYRSLPLWNKSSTVVLALEEMLAVHGTNTKMYQAIKGWYSLDEGFSPILVGMIEGRVDVPFRFGQAIRVTPSFVVFDGYKPGLEGKAEGQRWYISPRTDAAEQMLIEAAKLHRIGQGLTQPHQVLAPISQTRTLLRTDRTSDNLRVLIGGAVDKPKEWEDAAPTPDRMEQCLSLHPDFYSFYD
ncbi:hypothetical protein HYS93_02405 [Candidatus Daviesbacteria bacterium]|nr:hypothetical protein [Candidatus Daviesbacteria bacterium]